MVSSRSVAARGLRIGSTAAWRAGLGTALAVVIGQPYLWLLGALAFSLRGGIVILMLPIIVLPTQVEVRQVLGGNLGSTGLTADFWSLITLATIAASALVLGALYALARIELAIFTRTVTDPETAEQRQWQSPRLPSGAERRSLAVRLFLVQALAVLAVGLCAVPLAAAVGQATLDEVLRPSSTASIYVRVVGHVGQPLILLGFGLVVVELLGAVATRRLLMRAHDLGAEMARERRSVELARAVATAVLGWALSVAVLLPALWAIGIAWESTRAAFLATVSLADLQREASFVVVAGLLAAVFLTALLLSGFVSAVRAGLWTVDRLP